MKNFGRYVIEVLKGIFTVGLLNLCKTIKAQWLLVLAVIVIVVTLCIIPQTTYITWIFIGIMAILTAIKAIIEAVFCLKDFFIHNQAGSELAVQDLNNLGGKIFDFLLSAIGFLQAIKILAHIVRISHSIGSSLGVVDDVTGAISKAISNITKR